MNINWGIIGVGDVTEMKSGPAFYKAENSRLVAVMRRDAFKAADYARRHQVDKWYSHADQLINDPQVDAVYIATPPDSHAEYAIRVMKAGKPVYVEKPMAVNYNQCLEMIRISENTGMPLFVAYYRRTLPAFLKVREWIENNVIGKILLVQINLFKEAAEKKMKYKELNWRVNPQISGAGHFYDLASHQFDFLDFVLGPIANIKAFASNQAGLYEAEDSVSAIWKHKSGVTGTGNWCFTVHKNEEQDSMDFIGENGKISISCFDHVPVRLTINGETSVFSFNNPEHISQHLIQQVVNELQGGEKCVSTGISAARTNWVLHEAVKEYYMQQ